MRGERGGLRPRGTAGPGRVRRRAPDGGNRVSGFRGRAAFPLPERDGRDLPTRRARGRTRRRRCRRARALARSGRRIAPRHRFLDTRSRGHLRIAPPLSRRGGGGGSAARRLRIRAGARTRGGRLPRHDAARGRRYRLGRGGPQSPRPHGDLSQALRGLADELESRPAEALERLGKLADERRRMRLPKPR
jgi:hypothetical protein